MAELESTSLVVEAGSLSSSHLLVFLITSGLHPHCPQLRALTQQQPNVRGFVFFVSPAPPTPAPSSPAEMEDGSCG